MAKGTAVPMGDNNLDDSAELTDKDREALRKSMGMDARKHTKMKKSM